MKSLHTKILTLLLGSVLVASFLIGGAGILNASRVVKEDSAQIMNLVCTEKVQEMNGKLLDIEQSVETIYRYADNQFTEDETLWADPTYMEAYTDKVGDVLVNAAESTDCSVAVYLRFNPDITSSSAGVFWAKEQGEGKFQSMEPTDLSLYDPDDISHVGWYYVPIANGGPTWMDPYENRNLDIYMISYIIPIYRGDIAIGVVGMDIDLSLLKDSVSAVSCYDTGYAFLANSNGDIIYHEMYPDGITVEEFDENLLAVGENMGADKKAGQVYSYKWYGENKRMVFKQLLNGMYLVITAPAAEIDETRNGLIIQCTVILLLVLTVAVVLGFQLVGQMTKPLLELTQAAGQIAKGDWNVAIRCESKDEVGVLAQTLRDTIGELNRYITYVSGLAYTDVVTGARNKQAYNEAVAKLEKEMADGYVRFSLILLDINNLKYINDTYGHGKGDAFIIAASAIMKQVFGKHPLYRICDEGFAILMKGGGEKEAIKLQKDFEMELESFNRERNTCPEDLVIATGMACYEADRDAGFADVYVRADRQMYQNKAVLNAKNGMQEDALKMLRMVFHKILKVNLTQDNYYEIKTYDEERSAGKGYSSSISEWLREFAATGQVYEEDRKEYYAFTDMETLRERLKEGETYLSLRYRRKVGKEFRWVQMEIVPSIEYTDEEQVIMFYVRDIHDSYTAELEYNKELETLTNTDSLTGLYNRHYMTQYCGKYIPEKGKEIGLIFCDLNGLKYANDHYGHAAGDELIVRFAKILRECFPTDMCCRMSGDEFVVCVLQKTETEFVQQVEVLQNRNRETKVPLASIGYCWRSATENFSELLTEAEDAMYRDKEVFYKEFPRYKR